MSQLYNNYLLYIDEKINISMIEGCSNPTTTDLVGGLGHLYRQNLPDIF